MSFFKKRKSILILGLLVPALVLMTACGTSAPADNTPAPATGPAAAVDSEDVPSASIVAVSFTKDEMTPETIQVKHGDNVTLNLKTDRPGSFHIHGYDLVKEAAVKEITQFRFVANATGRFRINFHGIAEPDKDGAGEMGVAKAEASSSGMEHAATGGDNSTSMSDGKGMDMSPAGNMDHGSMEHGPAESAVPVNIDITAEVAEEGGVHVSVNTDGWRWAPEDVNGANNDGAGHAHIYADGVKLTRVYGNYHYIPTLDSGAREIKVSLNSNGHSELTWQGSKLESAVTLTVPEMSATSHSDMGSMMEPVAADAPMSLEVMAHEDALGGYNVQVDPQGFEFSQTVGAEHEPGKGYARLSVNGEVFNRLYVPWLQVPAQGEGMHTFTVTLLNNEGRPYQYNGQAVEATIMVHEEAVAEDSDGAAADHHDGGSPQQATSGHHGSGPDAAAAAASDHHSGAAAAGAVNFVELEVGYLEVLP